MEPMPLPTQRRDTQICSTGHIEKKARNVLLSSDSIGFIDKCFHVLYENKCYSCRCEDLKRHFSCKGQTSPSFSSSSSFLRPSPILQSHDGTVVMIFNFVTNSYLQFIMMTVQRRSLSLTLSTVGSVAHPSEPARNVQ